MPLTCTMCGDHVEKICVTNESDIVCESCYNLKKSFDILYKDQKVKVFVDVFKNEDVIYYNIFLYDFVNEDFQIITRRTDFVDIFKAKYEVILFVCDYIDMITNVVIYTDFKTLIHHLDGSYKTRSRSMKDEYYRLREFVNQGLEVRYIEKAYNLARMCPLVFKFFHKFEDYNRKTGFQYKKGDKKVDNQPKTAGEPSLDDFE